MQLYNLKLPDEKVSYRKAVRKGLGSARGLFFPETVPQLNHVPELLELDFVSRSTAILQTLIEDEIEPERLASIVAEAFDFPVPLVPVTEQIHTLELFHGPTLAFKDFGARFMARCLGLFNDGGPITVLTATSGDTGAAVAHAFYGLPNIRVVVLYPKGMVSPLQEKLFCTLGGNIHTLAVNGAFDDCQTLVKRAFDDDTLRMRLGLNSANSINISRLIAQCCYYFEAVARLPHRRDVVVAVPSGNFGNLTAGMMARAMGLPIKRFIAATNINDTVPRYLASGRWDPKPTIATISNAMDVSQPSNWPRIVELAKQRGWDLDEILSGARVDDQVTRTALGALHEQGYLSEPHGAVAYHCLDQALQPGETGIFLGTAHPAKFKETVEQTLQVDLPLPPPLARVADKALLSREIGTGFDAFRECLLSLG